MKLILSTLALVLTAALADAGPLCRAAGNVKARHDARVEHRRGNAAPSACQSSPQGTHASAAVSSGATCANGRCPLPGAALSTSPLGR